VSVSNLDHIIPIDMHSYNQKNTYPASSSNFKNGNSESDDTRGTPFEECNLPSTVASESDNLLTKQEPVAAEENISAAEKSPKSEKSKSNAKSSSSQATSSFANISSDDEEEVRNSAEQMMELDTDEEEEQQNSSHV